MQIRKAVLADIDQCVSLCRIEAFKMPGDIYPDKDVLIPSLNQVFLVAEEKGEILGLIVGYFLLRKIVYIDMLTVDEKHRGRNIGSKLVKAIREEFKNIGVESFWLIAPTKSENTLAFYRKNGLTEGGQYTFFSEGI